ncbi:hypothetical protein [Paracoccus marcusii]|uniref:hypothetical protein n=1 Tax=Paracoccus marcusii TaxID=59779 RepID=UPI0035A6E2B7
MVDNALDGNIDPSEKSDLPETSKTVESKIETSSLQSTLLSKKILIKFLPWLFLFLTIAALTYLIFQKYWLNNRPLFEDNIEERYIDVIRELGMSPVYPPREEIRVGDMFFTAFDSDRNAIARVWVGRMDAIVKQADEMASTFGTPVTNTSTPRNPVPAQTQSSDPKPEPVILDLRNAWLESLPIISLPSITGSSAGAAALGGQQPEISGFVSDQRLKDVSINFPDVRVHGFPKGAVTLRQDFKEQFLSETCAYAPAAHEMLESIVESRNMTCIPEIAEITKNTNIERSLQTCRLEIITRVFLTDQIRFEYGNRSENSISLGNGSQAPKFIKINNIEVSKNGDESENQDLSNISTATENMATSSNSLSLNAAGRVKTTFEFIKDFNRAVTIGFDSISPSYIRWTECQ